MPKWKLKRTIQCAKCPWRKDVNPHEIPNGYSREKHCALKKTIAKHEGIEGIVEAILAPTMSAMACHENHDAHCIGWLMNQIGPGNNIALRLRMRSCENADKVKTIGEQHETFEETIPCEAGSQDGHRNDRPQLDRNQTSKQSVRSRDRSAEVRAPKVNRRIKSPAT